MNFAKQQLLADNWQQIIEVSQRYQAEQVFTPYQEQVENFVMRVPLVGLFSAGKSTLINKLINDNLLSVQITPETAMAVEFYYTDEDEKFIGHYANKEIVLTRMILPIKTLKNYQTILILVHIHGFQPISRLQFYNNFHILA